MGRDLDDAHEANCSWQPASGPTCRSQCSTVFTMPTDSLPTPEAWHAELAKKDRAVRSAIAATSVETENAALHRRLDALMAELRIALAAVAVRDAILREQTAALHERDVEVAASQARSLSAQSQLETVQATLSWRLSRRAARVLRVPRRLVRR